jgi:hypothetical protein
MWGHTVGSPSRGKNVRENREYRIASTSSVGGCSMPDGSQRDIQPSIDVMFSKRCVINSKCVVKRTVTFGIGCPAAFKTLQQIGAISDDGGS